MLVHGFRAKKKANNDHLRSVFIRVSELNKCAWLVSFNQRDTFAVVLFEVIGPASQVAIPSGVEVIDRGGATILPGFINAHVHDAYNESRLEAWAQAGVTTVRDEGIISGSCQLTRLVALRDQWVISPQYSLMSEAGMTPMQIIVAATRNAARVRNLEDKLGTLEAGKLADIFIINGDPLYDLSTFTQVKMVIPGGEIIRQ